LLLELLLELLLLLLLSPSVNVGAGSVPGIPYDHPLRGGVAPVSLVCQ
jgi:hypothetical protein